MPSDDCQVLGKIDLMIAETAEHWRLSRMAALDRMILRLAIGEFLDSSPPRNVVINEPWAWRKHSAEGSPSSSSMEFWMP